MIPNTTPLALAEESPGSGVYSAMFGGVLITVDTLKREARMVTAPNIASDADFDKAQTVLSRLGITALAATSAMLGSLVLTTASF
jgi:hypothetical protein